MRTGAKSCKSCRSRQEVSNEYLLAKFGVDTAEIEDSPVYRRRRRRRERALQNFAVLSKKSD